MSLWRQIARGVHILKIRKATDQEVVDEVSPGDARQLIAGRHSTQNIVECLHNAW